MANVSRMDSKAPAQHSMFSVVLLLLCLQLDLRPLLQGGCAVSERKNKTICMSSAHTMPLVSPARCPLDEGHPPPTCPSLCLPPVSLCSASFPKAFPESHRTPHLNSWKICAYVCPQTCHMALQPHLSVSLSPLLGSELPEGKTVPLSSSPASHTVPGTHWMPCIE